MAEITVSPQFTAQLKEICGYYAEHYSLESAERLYEEVFAEIENCRGFHADGKESIFSALIAKSAVFCTEYIKFFTNSKTITSSSTQ